MPTVWPDDDIDDAFEHWRDRELERQAERENRGETPQPGATEMPDKPAPKQP